MRHPQVQRVCLEAAVPALLEAILDCAKHKPEEYITDVDLLTVYLEQVGCYRCVCMISRTR